MGQTSGEIKERISEQRSELTQDIDELRTKVKSSLDWRAQLNARPIAIMGVALGAGVLVSSMISNRRSGSVEQNRRPMLSGSTDRRESRHSDAPATQEQKRRVSESWDNTKAALLGVAAARAHQFLAEVVPGFRDEYQKAEERNISLRNEHAHSGAPDWQHSGGNTPTTASRGREYAGTDNPNTMARTPNTVAPEREYSAQSRTNQSQMR